MKRLLTITLCALLAAVCVGCSSGESSEATPTPEPTELPQVSATAEPQPSDSAAPEVSAEATAQPEAGKYIPGEYVITVRGMGGKFDVHVTFDANSIVSIEAPENHETENIGSRAIDEVIPAMIEAQSTDVDGVTGATVTSNALKEAVEEAIKQATPQS